MYGFRGALMNKNGSVFDKAYKIIEHAPQAVNWESYEKQMIKEYKSLIQTDGNKESVFQEFFERNPSFLPGSHGVLGESGHAPYNNVLITQPVLQGLTSYRPDFLWIATDSLNVYPVFIEIETPEKSGLQKVALQLQNLPKHRTN